MLDPGSYNRFVVLLYYITDRKAFTGGPAEQRASLLKCIEAAAQCGVDYVQIREKDLDPAELELLAREALHLIRAESHTTRLLINSHVDVALSAGADGVHLPAHSAPAWRIREQWREKIDREPLIGVSAHSVGDVQKAAQEGASFTVLAPIFEKVATGAQGIGVEELRSACASSGIPVFALGGLRLGNARACLEVGAAGIAAIRLFQESSIRQTVDALRWLGRNLHQYCPPNDSESSRT